MNTSTAWTTAQLQNALAKELTPAGRAAAAANIRALAARAEGDAERRYFEVAAQALDDWSSPSQEEVHCPASPSSLSSPRDLTGEAPIRRTGARMHERSTS
jgi:hypothetical protein